MTRTDLVCEFAYDPDGNLVSDGVFAYAYDSANRLTAVSSNGISVATFAYDAKSRRIRKTMPSATHTYFYDSAYTYDAFSRTVAATGPLADTLPHRFSTKYFDLETGLYYYGYRNYSPTLMRWLTRDPIEEDGGANLYCFCLNNVFARVDALGQASIANYVLGNLGYDSSRPLLGPYGLPVPALAARLQIQFYISGNYAECCKNGKKIT